MPVICRDGVVSVDALSYLRFLEKQRNIDDDFNTANRKRDDFVAIVIHLRRIDSKVCMADFLTKI